MASNFPPIMVESSGIEVLSLSEESESDNEAVEEISEPNLLSPKHRAAVLSVLQQSLGNMYEEEVLTDLQVNVQGQSFKCHKVIMAALSGYFHSLLLSGMKESQNDEVELKDVSKMTFQRTLQYIYVGENVVADQTVDELLKASVLLQIKPLEEQCVEFLHQQLSPANCIGVWRLGKDYGIPRLIETSWKLVLQGFGDVVCGDQFRSLEKDDLVAILDDPDLNRTNEDSICKAVLEWIKSDLTNREQHLNELMEFTCLPKVSDPYMFDLVADLEFLQRNSRYKESVMDALRYHLKPDDRPSIMAKQVCFRNDPDFQKVAVLIGGYYIQEDPMRTMLCLNLKTKTWYTAASVPHEPGEDFATCVHRNEIYLSGGSRSMDRFVKYSSTTNDWIAQPCLMTGRECHAMAEVEDVIYVLGGQTSTKDAGNSLVEDIDAYNITTGTWSKAGKLQYPLESLSAVAFDNKIYTFGGMDDRRATSSAIQCFDPSNGSCSLAGSLPKPTRFPLVVAFNSNVYVICSEGVVYRFDKTQTVSKVADFDTRAKFGLYVDGSKLVILGGEKEDGVLLDDILQIDVRSGGVRKLSATLDIPFSGFRMEPLVVPKSLLVQPGFNVQGQNLFDPDLEMLQQKKKGWKASLYEEEMPIRKLERPVYKERVSK